MSTCHNTCLEVRAVSAPVRWLLGTEGHQTLWQEIPLPTGPAQHFFQMLDLENTDFKKLLLIFGGKYYFYNL